MGSVTGQIIISKAGKQIITGAIAPANPSTNDLWLDTTDNKDILKRWDGEEWNRVNNPNPDIADALNTFKTNYYTKEETNNKITTVIGETTITKKDGTVVNMKDAINSTMETAEGFSRTVSNIETKVDDLEANALTVETFTSEIKQTDSAIALAVGSSLSSTFAAKGELALVVKTDENGKKYSELATDVDVINFHSGDIIIDSEDFKLNASGEITATGGTIGGWAINNDLLTSGSGNCVISLNSDGSISSLSYDDSGKINNISGICDGILYASTPGTYTLKGETLNISRDTNIYNGKITIGSYENDGTYERNPFQIQEYSPFKFSELRLNAPSGVSDFSLELNNLNSLVTYLRSDGYFWTTSEIHADNGFYGKSLTTDEDITVKGHLIATKHTGKIYNGITNLSSVVPSIIAGGDVSEPHLEFYPNGIYSKDASGVTDLFLNYNMGNVYTSNLYSYNLYSNSLNSANDVIANYGSTNQISLSSVNTKISEISTGKDLALNKDIGMYANSDTHYLKLGYIDISSNYQNNILLVTSAFWGNQHGSGDIIYLQGTTSSGTTQYSIYANHLGGTQRKFYYSRNNNRIYLYVYVTGGNSYGRWNVQQILTNYNQFVAETKPNCSSSGLNEMLYISYTRTEVQNKLAETWSAAIIDNTKGHVFTNNSAYFNNAKVLNLTANMTASVTLSSGTEIFRVRSGYRPVSNWIEIPVFSQKGSILKVSNGHIELGKSDGVAKWYGPGISNNGLLNKDDKILFTLNYIYS